MLSLLDTLQLAADENTTIRREPSKVEKKGIEIANELYSSGMEQFNQISFVS